MGDIHQNMWVFIFRRKIKMHRFQLVEFDDAYKDEVRKNSGKDTTERYIMPLYYNTFTDDLHFGWMYNVIELCFLYSNQTTNLIKII